MKMKYLMYYKVVPNYNFWFQNEDGEDCVLSEDSFSYKDMDTTYSP